MIKTDEISQLLKAQLQGFEKRLDVAEVGYVISVGDGIARVYGLDKVMAGELLAFPHDLYGMALNLEEDSVGVVLMGETDLVKEGDEVRRTGEIMSVPVSSGLLGRVVDPLGQPVDGKGPIEEERRVPIERIAPGIVAREPVKTPLQTGLKAIDTMIPIGRGQRELIIGDRQTGKTAIAIDSIINQRETGVICIYVAVGQKRSTIAQVVKTLERYGFEWDGEVLYQSRRQSCYDEALQTLLRDERLYACSCTRKEIAAIARQGEEGPVYPGTCRGKPPSGRKARALRLFTDDRLITFADTVYGAVTQRVETEVGDFVVQRADGLTAYQLAVVVDDALQGVTEVVRGADLLFSTPRQILLQQLLDYPTPDYLHVPLARNAAGEKLSKQTGATALDPSRPGPALMAALTFLGQHPPPGLGEESLETIWEWAIAHWKVAAIPRSETAQTR
ncbi:MAG: tRNA glutamyl-Q(34) synthetase GluQRS [Acidobacteriota bacterium]